jgi:hypothetical protein
MLETRPKVTLFNSLFNTRGLRRSRNMKRFAYTSLNAFRKKLSFPRDTVRFPVCAYYHWL